MLIVQYKFNTIDDVVPIFNSEFTTFTINDIDNGDGTTTRTIEHGTLPTIISFKDKKITELLDINTSNVTNMDYMFGGCSSLTSLNLNNFDTSKVTRMGSMFTNCSSLTSLDLSNFDTSNVVGMDYMFGGCSSLTSLNLNNFDTSKVTDMYSMFYNCSSLTLLDLSNFDTSRVTRMSSMFGSCSKLTSLDLSNFDTSNVTDMRNMFTSCSKLTSLDLSNFDTSNVTDMGNMFSNCSNLVSLDLSNFDMSKVEDNVGVFDGCSKFAEVYMLKCMIDTIYAIGTLLPNMAIDKKGTVHLRRGITVDEEIFQSKHWDVNYIIIPPNQITGLNVVVENNMYILGWDIESTATSYKVFVDGYELDETSENRYTLITEYNNEFTITGINESGSSPHSKPLHVKTEPNKPLATTVSHGDDVNGYNFSVSFVDDSDIETGYIIRYKIDDEEEVDIALDSANKGDTINYRFSVAPILDKIAIQVLAVNEIGESVFVDPIVFYMSPTPIYAYDVYSKDIVIAWNDKFSSESRYVVRWKVNREDVYRYDYINTEVGISGEIQHRIPLDESSELEFSICAVIENKIHLYTKIIIGSKINDANCKPPLNFKYDWTNIGEVGFTWSDIHDNELEYEICLDLDGNVDNIKLSPNSENYTYTFDKYGILKAKVRVKNHLVYSAYSSEHMIIYREVSGLPPSFVKRTPSDNGYFIQWEAQEYVHKYSLNIVKNGLESVEIDTQYDSYDLSLDRDKIIDYEVYVKTHYVGGVISEKSSSMFFKPTFEANSNEMIRYENTRELYEPSFITHQKNIKLEELLNIVSLCGTESINPIDTKNIDEFQLEFFPYEFSVWGKDLEEKYYFDNWVINDNMRMSEDELLTISYSQTIEEYKMPMEIKTAYAMDYPVIAAINKTTIVTIGDSITSGHPNFWAETMTGNEKSQYQYWLNRRLKGQFTIYNKGYGSDTTDKMLARFNRDVISVYCQYCIIQGGTNDLYWAMAESSGDQAALDRRLQTMKDNIMEMVKRCWDNDIIPVIGTLIPRTGATGIYKTALYDYNEWIINYCTVNDNIFYIDFFNAGKDNIPPTPLEDPTNPGAMNPIYDGKHLLSLNLLNCGKILKITKLQRNLKR